MRESVLSLDEHSGDLPYFFFLSFLPCLLLPPFSDFPSSLLPFHRTRMLVFSSTARPSSFGVFLHHPLLIFHDFSSLSEEEILNFLVIFSYFSATAVVPPLIRFSLLLNPDFFSPLAYRISPFPARRKDFRRSRFLTLTPGKHFSFPSEC